MASSEEPRKKRWTREEIDRLIGTVNEWIEDEAAKQLGRKRKPRDDQDLQIAMYPRYPPNSYPPRMGS